MRFTYEDKLKMYDLWKNHYYSPKRIAKQYNVDPKLIRYIVHLMDYHGVKIIKHGKNKYYSPEFKINVINRVLINHESIFQVSLDLGLTSYGMLNNWIKPFIENGYNIIKKQRGRKSHEQKESKDELDAI